MPMHRLYGVMPAVVTEEFRRTVINQFLVCLVVFAHPVRTHKTLLIHYVLEAYTDYHTLFFGYYLEGF